MLLVFSALLWLPNPLYWVSVLTLIWFLPAALSIAWDLVHKPHRRPLKQHLQLVSAGALKRILRIGLTIMILPTRPVTHYTLLELRFGDLV